MIIFCIFLYYLINEEYEIIVQGRRLSKNKYPRCNNPERTKQMEQILNFQVPAEGPRTGDFTTYTVLSFEAS